jgi:hypothetical protein
VTLLISAVSLLLLISNQSAIALEESKEPVDYYIKNGERVKLKILEGKIGVVIRPEQEPDGLRLLMGDAKWEVDKTLPGNMQILKLENDQDTAELEKLVRAINKRNAEKGDDAVIKAVGIVVETEGSETPLLVTDQFVVDRFAGGRLQYKKRWWNVMSSTVRRSISSIVRENTPLSTSSRWLVSR